MKKKVSQTAQFSVVTYDSPSGALYDLYINGSFYNSYTSLSLLTADMQALIMGVLEV
jgi:hypothetical protein